MVAGGVCSQVVEWMDGHLDGGWMWGAGVNADMPGRWGTSGTRKASTKIFINGNAFMWSLSGRVTSRPGAGRTVQRRAGDEGAVFP